ncbi:MAG: 3-phosphoshikimate 1-carboxyvinyltransferase [Chloroflexi bacterium]|nr:3-phosphoshikimate 1-carboxyvinyltransferase [Chloroflexota bacterium]
MKRIEPTSHPINATLTLPGSKSYTNRALIIAALADGTSTLRQALFSDDTAYMAEALRHLGIPVRADETAKTFTVEGKGGKIPADRAELFVGLSGTSARFLTALAALGHGRYCVDGVARMRERPMQPLFESIRQLGGAIRPLHKDGCLPIEIAGHGLRGGTAQMAGDQSSQYFSALLMAAPYMSEGLDLAVIGDLIHGQYVTMTMKSMADFGVVATAEEERRFRVAPGQHYSARTYDVEPDASAASYFFAAAALTGGTVRVENLGADSAQGDLEFVDVLADMGCAVEKSAAHVRVSGPGKLRGVDIDMRAFSDTFMTLAALAPFAEGPTVIRGIAHTRLQETDRVSATAQELRKLGVSVAESHDSLRIEPGPMRGATIDPHDDHRIAMSFALIGLRLPGVAISNPECVAKTFPDFFARLEEVVHSTTRSAHRL